MSTTLKIPHPLRDLYDETDLPQIIRRSLNCILLGNICGNVHGIICNGGSAAVVGLATSMGATDITFAVLTSIGQAAALLQIPFSMLVNRTHKRKLYLLTIGLISRALWMIFGLIPFLVPAGTVNYQLYTMIFLMGLSACLGSVINPCWFPWLSDLTPDRIRSRWLSVRDVILSVVNICAGLLIAFLLDHLPAQTKYVIIFLIGGFIGAADMICFAFCKEQFTAPPQKLKFSEVIGGILKNRPFMRFMIFWTCWCFTANMTGVYMTPYSMNVMGLTFTQIMLFGTVASCLAAIFTVQRWGRAMNRYGSQSVMLITCIGAAVTPLFYLLASPGNVWPTLLHNFIGAMFWCGANLSASNMQLSISSPETRPSYVAVFSCVTALLGSTLGSLTAGALLGVFERSGEFTGWMDRYKVLFLIATVMRLGSVLVLVPRMENDRDGTAKELMNSIMAKVTRRR